MYRYQKQVSTLRQAAELPLDESTDADSVFSRSTNRTHGQSLGSESDNAR
jgi:hypothetical protein